MAGVLCWIATRSFRVRQDALARGEALFARYGAFTIFFARFVVGLRIIAGPLAGVLRMRWPAFVLFNFLGAVVWVSLIASAGYLFGQHWRVLAPTLTRINVVVLLVAVAVVVFLWRKERKSSHAAP